MRVELRVDATLRSVRLLAAAARGVLAEWAVPEEKASLLELALVEAATNVVRHAYRGAPGHEIRVRLTRDAGTVVLAVADRGRSFDPSKVPPPPAPDPADPKTWPEGGMGLALIRASCDEVTYASEAGENVLSLTLRLPAAGGRERGGRA